MFKALFPGSFDPPTLGHIEIIKRAAELFDEFIVGIGSNYAKSKSLLRSQEKMEILQEETKHLKGVQVMSFSGLVIDFAKSQGVKILVRALRSERDFEYEVQMARANRKLGKGLETLFLSSEDPHISSTLIRELASHRADLKSFVPKKVETFLHKHIQQEK